MSGAASVIAAIATAAGSGAVSIIRLSGPGSLKILEKVFTVAPRQGNAPLRLSGGLNAPAGNGPDNTLTAAGPWRPRVMRLGQVKDPESGRLLDEALAVWLPGPRSFTGEDVCEIQGHGGQAVTALVLTAVLKAGARLAEPGEFTRRAFLNGRLDLTEAEAVADLIAARGEAEAALAARQLSGRLSERIKNIHQAVFSSMVELTADIDFSDDLEPLDLPGLKAKLSDGALPEIAGLLKDGLAGRPFREGLRLALVGAPNVGKSSLFNALIGQKRAMVSLAPGTTRDYITTSAIWRGLNVELCDTAGLSAAPVDELDALGQESSRSRISDSDLVLWVRDTTRPEEDGGLGPADFASKKYVVVWNKADLAAPPPIAVKGECRAVVSAGSGEGLDELKGLILEMATGQDSQWVPEVVPNARHQAALAEASAALTAVCAAIDEGQPPDICAFELGSALNALDRIVGRASTADDVLNEIFGRFCLGK